MDREITNPRARDTRTPRPPARIPLAPYVPSIDSGVTSLRASACCERIFFFFFFSGWLFLPPTIRPPVLSNLPLNRLRSHSRRKKRLINDKRCARYVAERCVPKWRYVWQIYFLRLNAVAEIILSGRNLAIN